MTRPGFDSFRVRDYHVNTAPTPSPSQEDRRCRVSGATRPSRRGVGREPDSPVRFCCRTVVAAVGEAAYGFVNWGPHEAWACSPEASRFTTGGVPGIAEAFLFVVTDAELLALKDGTRHP